MTPIESKYSQQPEFPKETEMGLSATRAIMALEAIGAKDAFKAMKILKEYGFVLVPEAQAQSLKVLAELHLVVVPQEHIEDLERKVADCESPIDEYENEKERSGERRK